MMNLWCVTALKKSLFFRAIGLRVKQPLLEFRSRGFCKTPAGDFAEPERHIYVQNMHILVTQT